MDKEAVYNFLSTFSGTHYVTPRDGDGDDRLPFLDAGLELTPGFAPVLAVAIEQLGKKQTSTHLVAVAAKASTSSRGNFRAFG